MTEDHDLLTVFVSSTDCGGVFVSDTGTGDAMCSIGTTRRNLRL